MARIAALLLAGFALFPGDPAGATACPPAPDISAAQARLIAAARAAPDAATANLLTPRFWSLWTEAPDPRAQDLLDRGMARRAASDFDAARETLDALVAYCPDYAEGWNQRAFVAFLTGDYEAALADLERALALNPGHVAALSGRALTEFALGRTEAGQRTLREALELNPWIPERRFLIEPPGKDI